MITIDTGQLATAVRELAADELVGEPLTSDDIWDIVGSIESRVAAKLESFAYQAIKECLVEDGYAMRDGKGRFVRIPLAQLRAYCEDLADDAVLGLLQENPAKAPNDSGGSNGT